MANAQESVWVRWFEEVWNQGRRETIDEMVGPDCIIHDGRAQTKGPAAFKLFFEGLQAEFADIHVDTHEVVAAGDLSCARWSSTMRHRASGKDVRVTGMSMVRFEGGRITEGWQNWDKLGMMEQLGMAPAASLHIVE